jgi:caffeoyl-CoA O-methyltransferase
MAKARGYWAAAGQSRKITGHVRPAVETLDRFLAEGQSGRYDFAFIDADKSSYDTYYERMLELVRPGGLVAIDNVLWSGKVVDPSDTTAEPSIRKLNADQADGRDTVLLPVADGIFMCRKR